MACLLHREGCHCSLRVHVLHLTGKGGAGADVVVLERREDTVRCMLHFSARMQWSIYDIYYIYSTAPYLDLQLRVNRSSRRALTIFWKPVLRTVTPPPLAGHCQLTRAAAGRLCLAGCLRKPPHGRGLLRGSVRRAGGGCGVACVRSRAEACYG
jgi:hypothetical protein